MIRIAYLAFMIVLLKCLYAISKVIFVACMCVIGIACVLVGAVCLSAYILWLGLTELFEVPMNAVRLGRKP